MEGTTDWDQIEESIKETGQAVQQAFPWWGWVLLALGLVVVIIAVTVIIVYSVRANQPNNTYGCVPGVGCRQGEGDQTEEQCIATCADEGAEVYRCNLQGECVQAQEGGGVTEAECQGYCRQFFDLKAAGQNNLSLQGLCVYGNETYAGFKDTDDDYLRLYLLQAPRQGGLEGIGINASGNGNGNGEEEEGGLPLESTVQLVVYNEDQPMQEWGTLTLLEPQVSKEDLLEANPELAKLDPEWLDDYKQLGITSEKSAQLWTIEESNEPNLLVLSTEVQGKRYFLYALDSPENACAYLPAMALQLDPNDPPEATPSEILDKAQFTLENE